jgi:hypothetical protein
MFKNHQSTYFSKQNSRFHHTFITIFLSLIIASFSTSTHAVWHQVTAKPRLIVREAPDAKSNKVGNARYGSKVNVLEKTNKHGSSRGKSGTWVKIQWKNSYGYAFDVYLTQLENKANESISTVTKKPKEPTKTESKKSNEKAASVPKTDFPDRTLVTEQPKDNSKNIADVAKSTVYIDDTYTDATLKKGSPACRSHKSMNKITSNINKNNPSTKLPYDCIKTSKLMPLRDIMQYKGLIKIEIETRGRILQYWTSSDYIIPSAVK